MDEFTFHPQRPPPQLCHGMGQIRFNEKKNENSNDNENNNYNEN